MVTELCRHGIDPSRCEGCTSEHQRVMSAVLGHQQDWNYQRAMTGGLCPHGRVTNGGRYGSRCPKCHAAMSPVRQERNVREHRAGPRAVRWANRSECLAFYREAARLTKTGVPHEVDHVIPLRGFIEYADGNAPVSGLHVETNLQVLTAVDNRAKRNRAPV
jgi:hypothetical protein